MRWLTLNQIIVTITPNALYEILFIIIRLTSFLIIQCVPVLHNKVMQQTFPYKCLMLLIAACHQMEEDWLVFLYKNNVSS